MTDWRNGSKIEILPGTVPANSGPHPTFVHCDEVELMTDEVWTAAHEKGGDVPDILKCRWVVKQNAYALLFDLFAVVYDEPGEADIMLATFESREVAEHIADLHNASLEAAA